MNNIVIAGRLTKGVELKYIPSTGKAVANFSVAVNRRFKRDVTDFFNVVVWDKQAENCANYIAKGSEVVIAGEMQQRNYDGGDGKKVYLWELIAQDVQFIGGKKMDPKPVNSFDASAGVEYSELPDEDVPF